MQQHLLGPTGLAVSEVVLGAYEFGRRVPPTRARDLMEAFRRHGGNVVDTADRYQDGSSERIVGTHVRDEREGWVVASKLYYGRRGAGPNDVGLSRRAIRRGVEGSLRRLGTDYLDVLVLHRFDPSTPVAETMSALGDLVVEGKVLYLGASNVTGHELTALDGTARDFCPPGTVGLVQAMYNPVDRGIELELLGAADRAGLTLQAYSPLAGGLLTGKYFGTGAGGVAGRLSSVLERLDEGRVDAARAYASTTSAAGIPPVALAVRWLLDRGAQPVVGPTTEAQLDAYLAGITLKVPDGLLTSVDRLAPPPRPYPYSSPGWPDRLAASPVRDALRRRGTTRGQ